MISPQSGIGAYPPPILPASNTNLLSQFRNVDAEIRRNVQKTMATAGPDATVTTSFTYSIGPDGQLYAVDGTVSTSRKVRGPKTALPGGEVQGESARQPIAINPDQNRRPLSKESLNEFLTRDLGVSSADFAALFSEPELDGANLAKLRGIDIGVRAHERQHFNAAGGLVQGTPEYELVEGPDGKLYAVGGHVDVGTTATNDPEKAKRDATSFAAAALAPGDASSQDLSVAKSALSNAAEAYGKVAFETRYGANNLVDFAA